MALPYQLLVDFLKKKCCLNINYEITAKELWLAFESYLEKNAPRIEVKQKGFHELMITYMNQAKKQLGQDQILRAKKHARIYYVGLTLLSLVPLKPVVEEKTREEKNTEKTTVELEEHVFAPRYLLQVKQQPVTYQLKVLALSYLPQIDELSPDQKFKEAQQYCNRFFELLQIAQQEPIDNEMIEKRKHEVLLLENRLRQLQMEIGEKAVTA